MRRRIRVDRWARWLGLLLLSGALLARSARAEESEDADDCSKEPSPTSTDAAKGAFRAGQTAFSEGAYGPAVHLWAQAYREDCRAHAILLNLATAHELLGRPDDAIHALRLFNRRAPDSPYVAANLRRIQQLERASAERTLQRTGRQRPAGAPAETPRAAPANDGDWALPLPLVVAVAGGALTVVGGVLYAEARFASAEAADRCGPTAMCTSLQGVIDGERARSRAEVAGWLTATGLATTAVGVVWHILVSDPAPLDHPRTHAGASWRPVVGRQSAVVYWNGSF